MNTASEFTQLRRTEKSAAPITLPLVLAVLGAIGFIAFICCFLTQDISPALRNPNPVRRIEPWLGFEHWPAAFQAASFTLCMTMWVCFSRLSILRGKLHPLFVVMAGVTVMTIIDPVATWATVNASDPRLWHFPDTWFWWNIQPTIQPVNMFAGYPYFFLTSVLIGQWVHRRLAARAKPDSFVVRRPLLARVVITYFSSCVFDPFLEIPVGFTGTLIYNQLIPSLTLWPGKYYQWPLYTPPTVSVMMALCGALAWENNNGNTLVESWLSKWRLSGARSWLSKLTVTSIILCVGYLVLYSLPWWWISHKSGLATSVAEWPYETMKVYDPDGFYRKAGHPGPYVGDEWATPPSDSSK